MKIVFFGTPDYVLPILSSLHKSFKHKSSESPISAVVTQKPKPAGRKKVMTYSPVDKWAFTKKIPVYHDSVDLIKKKVRADIGVLASYGEIIPKDVISHLSFGVLNIHPSLLPKWRGASPVQASIISEDKAGVTIIRLDEKLDHGPIISQFTEEVSIDDTTETLRKRLFEKSAEVLTTLLPAYIKGKITPREQDHDKATFTTQIKKADGFIPPKYVKDALEGKSIKGKWKIAFMKTKYSQASLIKDFTIHYTPTTFHRFIRAMQPWPHAWTRVKILRDEDIKILRLKILKAHLEPSQTTSSQLPATKLILDEVQLEGKNPVSWKQFKEGHTTVMFE